MSIAEIDAKKKPGDSQQERTLVVVTHTHWDREWYLPFQNYRFKLVRLIDKVLDILDNDPEFKYFTLDGQTIVLEDYLEIRPERKADLKRHIQSGRLVIGPWYILPDQFLISGEAHIQNMLLGLKISAEFGAAMKVGYIPDSFGQIGQMPQILRAFGIDTAVFWRGVGPEIKQIEFLWEAPDGSIVQAAHLPGSANIGGYSTAMAWNTGIEGAVSQLDAVESFLIKRAASGISLVMNGNDHLEPSPEIPRIMSRVEEIMQAKGKNYKLVHGTLPLFLEKVRETGVWERPETPRHKGEFRHNQLAHLLPGVLSARMWIKQWNAKIENMLEREVGLALAWSKFLSTNNSSYNADSLLKMYQTAWKYLLQNDPHDSICGCSIDQVHEEMKTRYAWAEQIALELRNEGFRTVVNAVDTSSVAKAENSLPVVIFNPVPLKRNEVATLQVAVGPELDDLVVTDNDGTLLPHLVTRRDREVLFTMDIPAFALNGMAAQAGDDGRVMDYSMTDLKFDRHLDDLANVTLDVTAVFNSAAGTSPTLMSYAMTEAQKYIDDGVQNFKLTVFRQSSIELQFLAKNVPGSGYKTFALRPRQTDEPTTTVEVKREPDVIENEFYQIEIDPKTGLFTIQDKETGATFRNINQFRSMGDAGDEYNYSPPTNDVTISNFFSAPQVLTRKSELEQAIEVTTAIEIPYGLSEDRQSRQKDRGFCPLTTVLTITPGSRRIDFETSFLNRSTDHRLQVLFPAPFLTKESKAEGIFDVVTRPVALPKFDSRWIEDPMPQAPQKSFVSINDAEGQLGLTVMNRGLPEYEIVTLTEGEEKVSAIAITLLRCVGWLSRDDLKTRRGHAGPGMATPGAQEQGYHYFHYAIMPHKGDWLISGAQQQAHAFNHPLMGMTAASQAGELPESKSFVEMLPRVVALSTIKQSEDGQSVIVRLWNPSDRDIPKAKVRLFKQAVLARLVSLDEQEVISDLQPDPEGWLDFPLPAHKIATLRVDF